MVQMTLQAPVPVDSLNVNGAPAHAASRNGTPTTQNTIVQAKNTNGGGGIGSHGRNAAIGTVKYCLTCKANPCRCPQ